MAQCSEVYLLVGPCSCSRNGLNTSDSLIRTAISPTSGSVARVRIPSNLGSHLKLERPGLIGLGVWSWNLGFQRCQT